MEKLAAFTRKRALTIVFFASLIVFLMILGRWLIAYSNDSSPLLTVEGRQMFLSELGWEIDTASEETKELTLPAETNKVLDEYNRLQLAQGYDLTKHLGEKCTSYTYRLTNYSDDEKAEVFVTLYLRGGNVIAGDIHSNSLNGFMHGIKPVPKA